jgi:hypothetical protein
MTECGSYACQVERLPDILNRVQIGLLRRPVQNRHIVPPQKVFCGPSSIISSIVPLENITELAGVFQGPFAKACFHSCVMGST